MYVPSWGGVFVFAGYTVLKMKIGLLERRYKEHIRYNTSNNSRSAYALHILHNKHEYGPMNITMSLLHPVHKSRRMNSSENFYIQLLQWNNTIINEKSEKYENPVWSYLRYTNQTRIHMTQFHFLPSNVQLQYSITDKHKHTHPLGTSILTYHFQTCAVMYSLVYLSIF
jgi:hypothetical protein